MALTNLTNISDKNSGGAPSPIRRLDARLEHLIILFGVPLLFLPKINIVSFAGQSAGIRIDDILLLVLAAILATTFTLGSKDSISKIETIFLAFLAACFVSNAFNLLANQQSNILYTARWAEYFVFFYVGAICRQRIRAVCWALILINGAVMALQAAGLAGGFASEGFQTSAGFRPYGLTGGPWEVGAVINICVAVLLATGQRNALVVFFITFPLILLSGARSPLLVHLALAVTHIYRHAPNKIAFILRGAIAGAIGITAFLSIPNPVIERSAQLANIENIHAAKEVYDRLDPQSKFSDLTYEVSEDGDASWLLRATKWMYACKLWLNTPTAWVIGLGPGFWGPALDGGWLRLLTETGIIGLVLFVTLFKRISSDFLMKTITMCLFLNMVFIDIHISYKAMSLIFFLIGANNRHALNTHNSTASATINPNHERKQ